MKFESVYTFKFSKSHSSVFYHKTLKNNDSMIVYLLEIVLNTKNIYENTKEYNKYNEKYNTTITCK